jgi:hypothetical protein
VRLFKGISVLRFTDMYADLLLNKATRVKSDYSPRDLNGAAGERNRPPHEDTNGPAALIGHFLGEGSQDGCECIDVAVRS